MCTDYEDNNLSDYESGSPPSRDECWPLFPSVQHKINVNFSNFKYSPVANNKDSTKFDFGEDYRELYKNYDRELRMRHKTNETSKWVTCQRSIENNPVSDEMGIPKTRSCEKLNPNGVNCKSMNLRNDFAAIRNSPVWCLDYLDNLIVIGCANGRLEFWEGTTGELKVIAFCVCFWFYATTILQCIFDDGCGIGVTSVKLVGSRVIVARLYGTLDLLQLQTYNQGKPIDWNFTSAYRRTHVRTGSAGSITDCKVNQV